MSLERLGKEPLGKGYKGCVRHIEIEKPVLGNNTADAQRLEQALKKELGTQLEKEGGNQGVSIPWHLLKNLPTFLRTWDYKARAVLFKDRRSWRLVDLIPPNLPYDGLPDAGLAGPGFPGPALTQSITYIELNVNQEFMNMFSGAKFYPHTDRARFPSVCN